MNHEWRRYWTSHRNWFHFFSQRSWSQLSYTRKGHSWIKIRALASVKVCRMLNYDFRSALLILQWISQVIYNRWPVERIFIWCKTFPITLGCLGYRQISWVKNATLQKTPSRNMSSLLTSTVMSILSFQLQAYKALEDPRGNETLDRQVSTINYTAKIKKSTCSILNDLKSTELTYSVQ